MANEFLSPLRRAFLHCFFSLDVGARFFADLFEKTKRKDLGLIEFYFAGALLQVNKLTRLPEMRKPLDLPTLQAFFTTLANDILDQLNPNDRPPWEHGTT